MESTQVQFIDRLQHGLTIDSNTANQRLDRFLRKLFRPYEDISLSMIFKALRKGDITVKTINSQQTLKNQGSTSLEAYRLHRGDSVLFNAHFLNLLSHKNPAHKKAYKGRTQTTYDLSDFQSRIIAEDDERLILNKPAGITIHPGNTSTHKKGGIDNSASQASLYDLIKQYYSSRGFAGSMFQPNVAYRLDRQTSGLIIVAKTYENLQYLNEIIRDREVEKRYYTIVLGAFPDELVCQQSVKKIVDPQFHRGKMIICDDDDEYAQSAHTVGYNEKTRSDPIFGQLSLVKVRLHTGRMHQIRVHFSHAGYPILGDIVYGLPSANRKLFKSYPIKRQLLHCYEYSFTNQNGESIRFSAELPQDFTTLISQ